MATLTAYFDASGHPDDPNIRALFVSGFISTEHKWSRFEGPWKKFVDDCGMDYFRMSKFYALWRDRPQERDALLVRGAKIIRQFTRKSFSCGLDLAIHRRYVAEYAIPHGAEYPFALAGTLAVSRVLKYLVSRGAAVENWEVRFLFEDGDLNKGKLISALGFIDKSLVPDFGNKADHPGLQAGDMLAWHHSRLLRERRPPRGGALEVLAGQRGTRKEFWTIGDEEWYAKNCHLWPKRGP